MSDVFGDPDDDYVEEDSQEESADTDGVGAEETSRAPAPSLPVVQAPMPMQTFGQDQAQVPAPQQASTILGMPLPLLAAISLGGIGLLAWYLSNNKKKASLDNVADDDYDDDGPDDEEEDEEDLEEEDEDEEPGDFDDDEDDQDGDRDEEDFPDGGEDDED